MQKNLDQRHIFTDYLRKIAESYDQISIISFNRVDYDRNCFGWKLIVYQDGKDLKINIFEPRSRIESLPSQALVLTENLGLLTVRLVDGKNQTVSERECHPKLPESIFIRNSFKELNKCAVDKSSLQSIKVMGWLKVLASTFIELIFDAPHLDKYLSNTKRQLMLKINRRIFQNPAIPLKASDISADLGFTVQYLNSVTSSFRGMTLNNYINFCKLEQLRFSLIRTSEKVSQLGADYGFNDVNYLIQLFKKFYKITPLQLRKNYTSRKEVSAEKLHGTGGFKILNPVSRPKKISQLSDKDKRCTLIVANNSKTELEIYWLSPEGEEIAMYVSEENERVHFGSAEGHCWMMLRGKARAYYRVGKENCIIIN